MNTGFFLTIEGLDGSGKTSQARLLATQLAAEGYNVKLTREPTHDGAIGALLRTILRGEVRAPPPDAMALLFVADRIDHCQREVKPWLDAGHVVICDRYDLSTLVYQTIARTEAMDGCVACDWTTNDPSALACFSCGDTRTVLTPGHDYAAWLRSLHLASAVQSDLTLVLDVDADTALARIRARGQVAEHFEREVFLLRAAALYRKASLLLPTGRSVATIDASRTEREVVTAVRAALAPFLPGRGS